MLPTATLQEVSWLYFSFLCLLLFDLLPESLRELLFNQLLEIFFGTSDGSVIIKHLTIGCCLAGVRTKVRLDSLLRVFLVEFEVCLAHALNRPIIIPVLPLYIFRLHATNGLVIEISD
jgi:hypothetical protein